MRTISSFGASPGIQAINGKTGTSQRSRPHGFFNEEDGDDKENGDADAETAAPAQQRPGIGNVINKIA